MSVFFHTEPPSLDLDYVNSLKIWLTSLKAIATTGPKENLERFRKLLATLPLDPPPPEIRDVCTKLEAMLSAQRPYSPTLKKITETALQSMPSQK